MNDVNVLKKSQKSKEKIVKVEIEKLKSKLTELEKENEKYISLLRDKEKVLFLKKKLLNFFIGMQYFEKLHENTE